METMTFNRSSINEKSLSRFTLSRKASDILDYLIANPSLIISYGQLAELFNSSPKGVGRIMKALGERQYFDVCARVMKKEDLGLTKFAA